VKLTFLGTRGYIDLWTPRHRYHSSTLVAYRGTKVMIDCGEDWRGRVSQRSPHAIVLSHGHPDHAGGVVGGAPCPVYATRRTWKSLKRYEMLDRRVVALRRPLRIRDLTFEAFPVEHSLVAPAVGFRVKAGRGTVFYAPDLVYIHDRGEALSGVHLYVGDGATLRRPLIRRRGKALIGHSPVSSQLAWCQKAGIPRAIFTHCGSEIVGGEARAVAREVRRMGRERGVEARVAYDGMQVVLR
jgi:phosphoribosyl 1,2-cyclic phosphodiesterase